MNNMIPLEIPRVSDDQVFEQLCKSIWQNDRKNQHVSINGRRGQNQHGIDVFGLNEKGFWFGIQCKVRRGKLLIKEISADVLLAKSFNPKLSKIIVCTTAMRDSKLQENFRLLSESHKEISLELLFWEDIEEELKKPENRNILARYFGHLFIKIDFLSNSIGRLCIIHLGDNRSLDTQYEILLGKTFGSDKKEDTGINYWRGNYFIINLNERKFETFRIPVFPTDLEQAFSNHFDQKRICNWLNQIDNIDRFLSNTEPTDFYYCEKASL